MGLTRTEAERRGIVIPDEYWLKVEKAGAPRLPEAAPPPSRFVEDGMTKLERAFWERANIAKDTGIFDEVMYEPMRFKVFGDRWYKPDVLTLRNHIEIHARTFWETKGYERAKDIQKLIAAADRYPWFTWVLVKREKMIWQCRYVTKCGIDRHVWRPDWLS